MASRHNTTRRRFLQVGALGGFGLSLTSLEQAKASGRNAGRPKACIFIFLWGGPSHIDTFDMKPLAPDNVRGEFRPIQTSVPGTHIVEHLPRTARLTQHYSIIRTLHHTRFIHQPAGSYLLTGVDPRVETAAQGAPSADDAPALGSLAARLAPARPGVKGQNTNLKGQTGGWLGRQSDPMVLAQDPNDRHFQVAGLTPVNDVPPDRLGQRRELLAHLNRRDAAFWPGRKTRSQRETQAMSDLQQRAFELADRAGIASVTLSSAAREAMMQQFLTALQENPADIPTWLVYADSLEEHGDPTGSFIRLSLELAAGHIPAEAAEARMIEFEELYATAHSETRELLAAYRSGLPTRFRVLSRVFIGHDPPREMFGYARTIAVGFLEAGCIKRGMNLGVGTYADGRPRVLQTIIVFNREVDEMAAGREPIQAGLGWLGHLQIEVGSLLTVVPPSASA